MQYKVESIKYKGKRKRQKKHVKTTIFMGIESGIASAKVPRYDGYA